MSEQRTLNVGEVVAGRYRLEMPIGAGGMGVVWRAQQITLGRPCAIKVMHGEYAARQGARARFEREAKVAARLKHPHAVEVYDFGEHEGALYLAMELLEGSSLRDIVDEDLPTLPVSDVLRIGAEVADVLVAAHAIGLVHRDLKPENIFLQKNDDGPPVAKVVDFGLAFIVGDEDAGRLTREGVVTGTPDYISPEQARGQTMGPPSDIYSFGCVLFEMLTGRTLFVGDSALVVARHLFLDPPTLRETAPDLKVPGAMDDLLRRMLDKDADKRPSASSVRDALTAMDPKASLRMGRGREDGRLLGRSARMLSAAPIDTETPTEARIEAAEPSDARARVVVYGALDDELVMALAARELVAEPSDEAVVADADAILALELDESELVPLIETGLPVVADAPTSDVSRLSALLRLGVAEVTMRPVEGGKVAKKLWRAIRRAARRSEG